MNLSRFKVILLYVLTTAFLLGQWTSAHAHLPVHHQYQGDRHGHVVEVHAHQVALLHANSIKLGHSEGNAAAVVDLDQDQCPPNSKTVDNSPSAPTNFASVRPPALVRTRYLPEGGSTLPRHLPPHIGEARAPPRHS